MNSRTSTPNFLENEVAVVDDVMGPEDSESTSIPNWYKQDIGEIYDHLNPRTKQGWVHQRSWQKRAVDSSGKPLASME
jgi:hypothetical protein